MHCWTTHSDRRTCASRRTDDSLIPLQTVYPNRRTFRQHHFHVLVHPLAEVPLVEAAAASPTTTPRESTTVSSASHREMPPLT